MDLWAVRLLLVLGLCTVTGCATGSGKSSMNYGPAVARAKKSCARLQKTKLHAPIQTKVKARMDAVKRLGDQGDGAEAFARADRLSVDCSREAQTRADLATMASDLEKDPGRHPREAKLQFYRLVSSGDYSGAMLCGDAMLQGQPGRCAAVASASPGPSGDPEDHLAEAAEDEDDRPRGPRLPVRGHRLMLSLGFGVGTAALGGVHDSASDVEVAFGADNYPLTLEETPASSLQINWGVDVRYYAPYHLMGQLGFGAIYNRGSSEFSTGSLRNENWGLELPLLAGVYSMLTDNLCLHGALGPAFLVWSRSLWSSEPGSAPDFKSDPAVGAHFAGGLDYVFNERYAVGLDLRYRLLRAGKLKEVETDRTLRSGELRGDDSGDSYEMDLSGFSAAFYMRFFVL